MAKKKQPIPAVVTADKVVLNYNSFARKLGNHEGNKKYKEIIDKHCEELMEAEDRNAVKEIIYNKLINTKVLVGGEEKNLTFWCPLKGGKEWELEKMEEPAVIKNFYDRLKTKYARENPESKNKFNQNKPNNGLEKLAAKSPKTVAFRSDDDFDWEQLKGGTKQHLDAIAGVLGDATKWEKFQPAGGQGEDEDLQSIKIPVVEGGAYHQIQVELDQKYLNPNQFSKLLKSLVAQVVKGQDSKSRIGIPNMEDLDVVNIQLHACKDGYPAQPIRARSKGTQLYSAVLNLTEEGTAPILFDGLNRAENANADETIEKMIMLWSGEKPPKNLETTIKTNNKAKKWIRDHGQLGVAKLDNDDKYGEGRLLANRSLVIYKSSVPNCLPKVVPPSDPIQIMITFDICAKNTQDDADHKAISLEEFYLQLFWDLKTDTANFLTDEHKLECQFLIKKFLRAGASAAMAGTCDEAIYDAKAICTRAAARGETIDNDGAGRFANGMKDAATLVKQFHTLKLELETRDDVISTQKIVEKTYQDLVKHFTKHMADLERINCLEEFGLLEKTRAKFQEKLTKSQEALEAAENEKKNCKDLLAKWETKLEKCISESAEMIRFQFANAN